jgi:hypothetical protein
MSKHLNGTTEIDRAAINRENAQHSTGPVTLEGKARSSQNALKHGLSAKALLLPSDDPAAFQRHLDTFLNEYQPQGPTEQQLVRTLANNSWQLDRVNRLEQALFTHSDENLTLDSQMRALASLSSHRHRLTRSFESTIKQLQQLQKERRSEEQKRLWDASRLSALAEHKGLPYDPAQDGFVFSKKDIEAFLQREQRYSDALLAYHNGHEDEEESDEDQQEDEK